MAIERSDTFTVAPEFKLHFFKLNLIIFIYLFNTIYLTVLSGAQIIQNKMIRRSVNMNWNICGRRQPWPDLKYNSGICLEEVKKITKIFVITEGVPA
jgi:hypothetical protein